MRGNSRVNFSSIDELNLAIVHSRFVQINFKKKCIYVLQTLFIRAIPLDSGRFTHRLSTG